ncbi:hypothetical protein [Oryza sativa Japonica Group]|uniref:Uncharacterized protein n=1 Tax=Oryza sativa subsp. japonica TaxID=39947 RepID=Q5QME1_ORYSJ|nr:hypothetical protein [Oryza sativa Japonica Group]
MAVPPKNDAEAFDQPDPNDERLPEEKLNTMAVRIAFFYRVMNGCGALAFAWATVVLLGGYATLIKQKDFWFVTIIVFMEATWLHGTDQDRLPSRGKPTLTSDRLIADTPLDSDNICVRCRYRRPSSFTAGTDLKLFTGMRRHQSHREL